MNKVLSLLLSKYERSKAFRQGEISAQRPQFALRNSNLAEDYNDELDYRKREAINRVLSELEAAGLIEIGWAKFLRGKQAEKVYLQPDMVGKAYAVAGISPKAERLEQLLQVLAPLQEHPWEWVQAFWQTARRNLQAKKTSGMDLDDLTGYADLVKVLGELPMLEDTVPKRVFSLKTLGDSKRFEQAVERRLVHLLKKYGAFEFERDDEYLDSVGLVAQPNPVFVSGPIEFEVGGKVINVSDFIGGTSFFPPMVNSLKVRKVKSETLVTVENLTSYHQMVEVYPDILVIYTGGFPHRTVQKLLKRIAEYLRELSREGGSFRQYHWGDLDYGGLKIYHYLKTRFFPQLRPLWMDSATYLENLDCGINFDSKYAAKMQDLKENPEFSEFHELIGLMLEKRLRLEQESLDPKAIQFFGARM